MQSLREGSSWSRDKSRASFVLTPVGSIFVGCEETPGSASGSRGVGTLIDGGDAYQPRCVTDT